MSLCCTIMARKSHLDAVARKKLAELQDTYPDADSFALESCAVTYSQWCYAVRRLHETGGPVLGGEPATPEVKDADGKVTQEARPKTGLYQNPWQSIVAKCQLLLTKLTRELGRGKQGKPGSKKGYCEGLMERLREAREQVKDFEPPALGLSEPGKETGT